MGRPVVSLGRLTVLTFIPLLSKFAAAAAALPLVSYSSTSNTITAMITVAAATSWLVPYPSAGQDHTTIFAAVALQLVPYPSGRTTMSLFEHSFLNF